VKYADGLVTLATEEMVLHGMVYRLMETAKGYGMEMIVEK
jgi:hypothetical protein